MLPHPAPALACVLLALSALPAPPPIPAPATPAAAPSTQAAPAPDPRGHSHNDYRRPRPLLDAIDAGMGSIEADVFPVEGDLLVGHDREELRPGRTLRAMYLDPLARLLRDEPDRLPSGPGGGPLILLVDIKADGPAAYAILEQQLEPLRAFLTRYEHGTVIDGRVTVVLSGARPIDTLASQPSRLAFIDGRLADLELPDGQRPRSLVPLISDSWTGRFSWLGFGPMPEEERRRLRGDVERAHRAGRLMRFWGTPNAEPVWQELLDAGVDLLNNDRPADAAGFILRHRPSLAPAEKTTDPRP